MFFHKSSINLHVTENIGDRAFLVRALQLSLGFSSKMPIPIMAYFETNGFLILQYVKRFSVPGLLFSPPVTLLLCVAPASGSYSGSVASWECNC